MLCLTGCLDGKSFKSSLNFVVFGVQRLFQRLDFVLQGLAQAVLRCFQRLNAVAREQRLCP